MTQAPFAVMAQYPFAATANPASDNVLFNTRFTEVLEPVQTVAPGTDFSLHLNDAGRLDLYTVGTGQNVFRMRRTAGQATEYDRADLGFEARALAVFDAPNKVKGADTPDIMGIDQGGALTLAKFNEETGAYVQKVSQPEKATEVLSQFKAVALDDTVYAYVVFDDGTVANNFLQLGDEAWASEHWAPLSAPGGGSAKVLKIATCQNNIRQNAIYAISPDKSVWFADSRNRFTEFQDLGFLTVRDIAVIEDSDNLLNIVAIGHDNQTSDPDGVWVKRQKKYPSEPGRIEWDDWDKISDRVDGEALRVSLDATGLVTIFVLGDGEENRLHVIREIRDARRGRTGWTIAFPLGNPVPHAVFAVAQDAQDLAEAFLISTDVTGGTQAVTRFWQDPSTTIWYSEHLRIAQPDEAIRLPVHSVEITVQDGTQVALPDAGVSIKCDTAGTLRLNGRSYPMGPLEAPVRLVTDPSGVIRATFVTNSLSSPTLVMRLDGMSEDEAITCEMNADLQDRLGKVTEDELLAQKKANGEPLVPGTTEDERKENAKAMAEISQKTMSLGKPQDQLRLMSQTPYLWGNSRPGPRYHFRARDDNPAHLDLAAVPEQHWRIRFPDQGSVRVEDITPDEAHATLSAAANKNTLPDEAMRSLGLGQSIGEFFGDLWQAVKNGVATIVEGLKEIVVTTIIDPIKKIVSAVKAVVKLVIDGIEYLVEQTIKLIQQAFDFLEGIWAKLKAFFEDLYKWLAFLFDIKDIARTSEAVEHMIEVGIDFSIVAVKHIRGQVEEGLNTISDRVKEAMDSWAKDIAGESFNSFSNKDQTPADKEKADDLSAHNPVGGAFRDNYQQARDPSGALAAQALADEDTTALDDILATLDQLSQNFQFGDGKQAFDDALGYFSKIGSSRGDMINLAMAGMVKVLEAVSLTAIALARGVILSIFDLLILLLKLVKRAATADIEVPIVGPIYKFFTGKELTFRVTGLMALLVAVPATIGYKAGTGTAPFKDQAAVDEFKRSVTVESLARSAGFSVSGGALAKASKTVGVGNSVKKVMQWCAFGTFVFRIFVEPLQNMIVGAKQLANIDEGPGIKKIKAFDFGSVVTGLVGACTWILRLLSSVFSAPWLNSSDAPAPGCGSGKAYGAIVWIMQLALGPVFGAVLWFAKVRFGKDTGLVNIIRLIIWGLVHTVMAVAQAIAGGFSSGLAIARGIISPIVAQFLWFGLLKEVSKPTKTISIWAVAGCSILGMGANAVMMAIEASADDEAAVAYAG
ncbi:hypothetical protein BWR18_04100 [Tateyamaria omphalii]|uniref:Uncharacterized protein n=2 Tax=Tateyamaria omphalii TaxID=299262 RepID=A0A1P8MSK0_9RHOB|nr:hypothetical protein BWR18_04100 [Tateyamaria omphalii]